MKNLLYVVSAFAVLFSARVQAQDEIELYFPNVTSGRLLPELLYNNVFFLVNDGEEAVSGHLEVFTNQGLLAREADLEIEPGEIESYSDLLFWVPTESLIRQPFEVIGWARLSLPMGTVVHVRHNLSVRDYFSFQVLSTANANAVVAGLVFRAVLPDFVTWSDPTHAFAIVNPSSEESAEVKVEYQEYGAGTLEVHLRNCQDEISVPPSQRVTRFLQNDLCERQFVDSYPPKQLEVTFSSNVPIVVSAMEFSPSTFGFSDLDARKLE